MTTNDAGYQDHDTVTDRHEHEPAEHGHDVENVGNAVREDDDNSPGLVNSVDSVDDDTSAPESESALIVLDSGDDPADSTPAAVSAGPAAADWHDLQGRFVDDPAAAVREAGGLVEEALAQLRGKVESGSTEDLRTAFRRYRELYASLH